MMLPLVKTTALAALLLLPMQAAFAQMTQDTQDAQNPVRTETFTIKALAASFAVTAAQEAIEACSTQSIRAVVVIVDASGNTRLIMVGDGANFNLVEDARRKAYTAATQHRSTLAMQKALAANPHMFVVPDSQLLLVGGGVPFYAGSQIVGAIGVEGGTPAAEDQCAQAGVDKLQSSLHPQPPQPGGRAAAPQPATPPK